MGWLDGIIGKRTDDPLQDLDPRIKQFLERESPHKLADPKSKTAASSTTNEAVGASSPPPSSALPPSSTSSTTTTTTTTTAAAQATGAAPPISTGTAGTTEAGAAEAGAAAGETQRIPPQSLFQDGRYAHLWKTYTPLHEIEAATKSDHEKLRDVVDAFKDRKAQIGRAAVENCVIQQEEWQDCLRAGSWKDTLVLCRNQVRAFEKCYVTQARLLKALGYYSAYGRTPEIEEDIQMHADSLYSRILAHEASAKEAKAAGQPAPEFDPRTHIRDSQERVAKLRKDAVATVPVPADELAEPNERVAAEWQKQLAELPEADRPAEEAALRADFQARAKLAKEVQKLWGDQEQEKREARAKTGEDVSRPNKMVWQQLLDKMKGQ